MLRFAVALLALPVAATFGGCEPPICTQLQVWLKNAACGEGANINTEPEILRFDALPGAEVGQHTRFSVVADDDDRDPLYYQWDFNDDGDWDLEGYKESAQSVRWRFRRPGVTYVTVRVSDFPRLPGGEGQATARARVRAYTREQHEANGDPVPAFTATPNPVRQGGTVLLDGSGTRDPEGDVLRYRWSFAPGVFANGSTTRLTPDATMLRTYPSSGTENVRLEVFDDYGNFAESAEQAVTVTPFGNNPRVDLQVEPNPATAGEEVLLSGARSTDPDGDIDRYEWDLDGAEGFERETSGPELRQVYNSPGNYRVGLRVFDAHGNRSSEVWVHLEVHPSPSSPTAALNIDPNPARPNELVFFLAGGSTDPEGDITLYEWDLDGTEGYELATTESDTSRTYAAAGTFTVRLRVTDATGLTAVDSETMVIEGDGERRLRGSRATRARRGPPRPFSATLAGRSGDVSNGGGGFLATGLGDLDAHLSGPSELSRAERVLERFLDSRWRTRLRLTEDETGGGATVRGLALAGPGGGGRACLRVRFAVRAGELPEGRLAVIGGTGSAARLRARGSYRFRVDSGGQATILGALRSALGKERALPSRCARLRAT